jgi:glycosyltransferase involved in cell wall biosynthesis
VLAPLPEVSVVVPSHERPLRLRWLLNALEEQTLDRSRWELVVVHDSLGDATEALLESHPLKLDGVLRHRRLDAGTGTPARQRNVGWQMARAPLIAFTDDDCRPEPGWLAALLETAAKHPGAIVQGAVRPDPYETDLMRATHFRTLEVDPPGPFAQTANILYPRPLLETTGGFDELLPTAAGEDTELAMRARAAGAGYVGQADAVVNHAVEAYGLRAYLRLAWKWRHLPLVVKRHSEIRKLYKFGVFWRPGHMWLVVAVAGLAAAPVSRRSALLALPYANDLLGRRGRNPRARLRAATEVPGRVAVDAVELAGLAWGSVRHRTLFL